MRRRFSEKYGYTKPREVLQIDNVDERLKNRIWNAINNIILEKIELQSGNFGNPFDTIKYQKDYDIFIKLYDEVFAEKEKPYLEFKKLSQNLHNKYESFIWYEIYNFLEDICFAHYSDEIIQTFKLTINKVLEEELSGYRLIENYIVQIIDEIEIKEIEEIFNSKYTPVKRHLSKALELISDRENPDYVNSIKESITAVESITKIITGKETDLASCLKQMKIDINKQFITGMNNIYGWTCKEDGIRHAHTGEELKTDFDEAKYMLVSCSAFINYLISKHENS